MTLLLLLALLGPALPAPAHDKAAPAVVETRTFRRSIPLEGLRGLNVDNVYGAITVTGDAGEDIRLVVSERIEANDQVELERARSATSLEISRRDNQILICADGPFRDPDDCTQWARGFRHKTGYRVFYELELRVPRAIDVTISTVEGDLKVSEVSGRLDVSGVEGAVEITEATGSVRAGSVNAPVHVRFAANPGEDCTFSNINREIDVEFPRDLSADLTFDTMNGKVATDFEHRILPPVARRNEERNGTTRYRLEVESAIRIGAGGPRHCFKSINGDITIRRL